ncbi:maleylpyruvate isomerase family mycothiol-dependent enzyme [Phycicoccus sp. CSK15P-2]|uniref:maleylpyruvate isomerase family mycothiol-dependent enzyme n=1 Tax=Phycicoccus sp. CSK15P-2 TaxID=2807627 RepID=UPI0019503F06|nr:maleylpyruvate isomerase family mycothiol-dependent enzyme [Phycicoccus sp. CSK15P-2]MBM6403812.1 maleylpyruvate isomerase family mycothiol-dependent enzyme [Phycicoccus sp. CSK15P-2]
MASDVDLLTLLDRHTERLLTTVQRVDDLAAPSLCAGWTRGHVVTHVARNADAFLALVRAAVDRTGETMYPSPEARDADIEAGATRDRDVQLEDLRRTARPLPAALRRIGPEHEGRLLARTPGVAVVTAENLPYMRLREVVYHHVDLDAGFGFADVEPELVELLLADELDRLRGVTDTPDVTLRTTEGDEWTIGLGTTEVSGDRAAVLAWLARGLTDGVTADPLPALPAGR